MRQGLRRILEEHADIAVIAECGSGIEAVELSRLHRPDVAVIDITMKGLNGIEATAEILHKSPKTAVLILSMHNDARYVARAVNAGARGYLLKDSVEGELLQAIRAIHSGREFFSPAVVPAAVSAMCSPEEAVDLYERLTERERHVYQLLAEGNANKDIAARLGLSLHTVETHRARIMEKLGVHSMAELVLGAVRRGIVS